MAEKKKRGAPFRALLAEKRAGKNDMAKVQDLRNDPTGGNTFGRHDNPSGDMTFYPPVGTKVLPYVDPEADYNTERLNEAIRIGEELAKGTK